MAVSITENALEQLANMRILAITKELGNFIQKFRDGSNYPAKTRPKEFAVLPKKEPRLPTSWRSVRQMRESPHRDLLTITAHYLVRAISGYRI